VKIQYKKVAVKFSWCFARPERTRFTSEIETPGLRIRGSNNGKFSRGKDKEKGVDRHEEAVDTKLTAGSQNMIDGGHQTKQRVQPKQHFS